MLSLLKLATLIAYRFCIYADYQGVAGQLVTEMGRRVSEMGRKSGIIVTNLGRKWQKWDAGGRNGTRF